MNINTNGKKMAHVKFSDRVSAVIILETNKTKSN